MTTSKMPSGNEYSAPTRDGGVYRPPARRRSKPVVDQVGHPLVSVEERIDTISAELLALSPESQENVKELIRIYHLTEQAIDKRRLLSDPVMSSGDPQPPGDKLVADLLIERNRKLESLNRKRRRILEDMNGEVYDFRVQFKNRLDKIEGWYDPDRVRDRLEKKAKEEEALAG